MESRRVRSKASPPPRRAGLRGRAGLPSSLEEDEPVGLPLLPHHIILEILTFLDARAIVRTRGVSRGLRADAPALIDKLEFHEGQKFPSFKTTKEYSGLKEVRLEGDNRLLCDAAAGLRGASSLHHLTICRPRSLVEKTPLSETTTEKLCALPLREFDMRRVEIVFPAGLLMPAWQTLEKLVIRDGLLDDTSIINLIGSISEAISTGDLPLRHLDLSRNLFGRDHAMRPLAEALRSFPEMETLELTANRVSSDGAKLVMRELLDGTCPRLRTLELSLNFLHNDALDSLANGIGLAGHGLQNLRMLGIGGRFSPDETVTSFESIARAIAMGGLPLLDYLHLQGDVGPTQVGPLLLEFRHGGCPNLAVVKLERAVLFHPAEDADSTEDAVISMLELVNSSWVPRLREVHVLGMNLGKGMEFAKEDRTAFYRAGSETSFHRLAKAGAKRGVMIFV